MSKIFSLVSILFFLVSCEQNIFEGENTTTKYPDNIGHEWEYNTVWKLEYYDTTGQIVSATTEQTENTIIRIVKDRDVISSYNNLILFESYDLSSTHNVNKIWYLNADSGLFAIAYSNPGASQPVLPKQGILTSQQFKNLIKTVGKYPGYFDPFNPLNQLADSIQYYIPPRKVLMYPLKIGSQWIELTEPFYRERFINRQQIINTNRKDYLCYKIESKWDWVPNLKFTDYIDLNAGLVMREIVADSVGSVLPGSPDIVGYFKSTSISMLVREQK